MFNQATVIKNKHRSANFIANSDFFNFIHADLTDRIQSLDKDLKDVLEVSYELPSSGPRQLDLISFSFGLQWVNDVQKFLANVKSLLKPDGIFICNFPTYGSLTNLRKILFLAEESTGNQHFPHISPFIRFEDVPTLLQQAGLFENITDYEVLMLEYESPIGLMKWLKNVGESNTLATRNHYSITKPMYKFLSNFKEPIFEDQINLVTLIASPSKGSIRLR